MLRNINLEVTPGELTVLIGPSGCGKSTLLRCLNGLETLDSGTIIKMGLFLEKTRTLINQRKNLIKKPKAIRENVGMVFQSFNLFPHLTLLEKYHQSSYSREKMDSKTAKEKANELLAKVGLYSHANHYPASYQVASNNEPL